MSNEKWKIFRLSLSSVLSSWWSGRQVRQRNPMHCFPIIGGHHLNRVPGAAIQECAVWTLADAFLTANTEIRINFDAPERRMIFVGDPEHAGFNGTILDASRRTCAPSAAVGGNCKNSRSLLARRLTIPFRHGSVFFYDIKQNRVPLLVFRSNKFLTPTLT